MGHKNSLKPIKLQNNFYHTELLCFNVVFFFCLFFNMELNVLVCVTLASFLASWQLQRNCCCAPITTQPLPLSRCLSGISHCAVTCYIVVKPDFCFVALITSSLFIYSRTRHWQLIDSLKPSDAWGCSWILSSLGVIVNHNLSLYCCNIDLSICPFIHSSPIFHNML